MDKTEILSALKNYAKDVNASLNNISNGIVFIKTESKLETLNEVIDFIEQNLTEVKEKPVAKETK